MMNSNMLYLSNIDEFKEDVLHNQIAVIMKDNFKNYFGRKVNIPEFNSWQNSLRVLKDVIEFAGLKNNLIALEYEIPYSTKRIDCLLFGKGEDNNSYVVVIELKQWNEVNIEVLEDEQNLLTTYTGGKIQRVSHPSSQVEGYVNHLINFKEVFEVDDKYKIKGCVYCHNYKKEIKKGLYHNCFNEVLEKYPLFSSDDVINLADKLKFLLSKGQGFEIFNRFMQSPIKPSKKLLENVSKIINNNKIFSLLDNQIVAKNLILSKVKKSKEKSIILVKGGPGTGKSVIALNILAELASKNKKILYACKSKPFIEALKKQVGKNGKLLFRNLYTFIPSRIEENALDVVLVDEAHRIGKSSNFQYTKKDDRTDMPQIEQLIRSAKTIVFFIDDKQNVRSQEIGNTKLIKEIAKEKGFNVEEVELLSQFRCNGSDSYLDWLEGILGYNDSPKLFYSKDNFELKIFDNIQEMYNKLSEKEQKLKNSARIVAGYCWPWSRKLDINGELIKDVKIGSFEMPWETNDKINPPKGYVKWFEWGYKTEGIKQIGCIYTVQGFEYDYIGVIIGKDLKYDNKNDCLVGNLEASRDPTLLRDKENFTKYVRNIYRVLLSRGMKGCYIYFLDKEVENYFKKYIL